jgi:hypothetical protein
MDPDEVHLHDGHARQQLIATGLDSDGYQRDLTREVVYEAADAGIVAVDAAGVVRPLGKGTTALRIRLEGNEGNPALECRVEVRVGEVAASPVSFTNDVMAVLGKAGCNSGACHGHDSGKGGLKLSLRGYLPSFDLEALTRDRMGRRVDLMTPDASLLLLKPAGAVAHGGGRRLTEGSDAYQMLLQWLAEGARGDLGQAPAVERIEVLPDMRLVPQPGMRQQLVVRAHYAGGGVRDVTHQAIYELSNEGVVEVGPQGLVESKRTGEAAVFVRYQSHMGLARFVVIRHQRGFSWNEPPADHFIDRHVEAKLRAIQVQPSPPATDAEFLRRVSFDTVGLPPAPEEVRAFLADPRLEKRALKIDELLEREEFGECWATYWLELSGTTESGDSARFKGMWLLSFWLRNAINGNLPYDQFVRKLVAGKGSSIDNGAVTHYLNRLPKQEVVPQLFLGVRTECAQCHDHPFDVWKQADYRALGEFFQDVGSKEMARDFWGREVHLFVSPEKLLPWEQGKTIHLRQPDGSTVEAPLQRDRRDVLVDWMFGPARRQTARALVNRVWGKLLGRGIVDPVDDMRFSNPPVNEPLLEALAEDFIARGYDFKHLVRSILSSRTYQRSSAPNESNAAEEQNFSHAHLKRLSAEQLLDAISMATGVDDEHPGAVPGMRAAQFPYAGVSGFLALFGRPAQRTSPCECIRSHEATLPQVLHLLNGDSMAARLRAEGGTLERLVAAGLDDRQLVEELYLAAYGRFPTDREFGVGTDFLRTADSRPAGAEDLLWALIASQEFLFNH